MVKTKKAHHKASGLVFGNYNKGFTIIELLVAIAVVAIISVAVVPNIMRSMPGYERKSFIANLNGLLRSAQSNAIVSYAVQQIVIDLGHRRIELREQAESKDKQGEITYKKVQSKYSNSTIIIPENIDFKNVIIEGFDELSRSSAKKTEETWFFVIPEGLTQEVTINFIDTNDRTYNDKPRPTGLVLNPFTAQFKEYDSFQK